MNKADLKKKWNTIIAPPKGWQGSLYFHNNLGQKIRYGYAPAEGKKKGTIVLTHGYGEHIDLYYEAIKRYQGMGYEVWAMDWQGHGESERDNLDDPQNPGTRDITDHTDDLDFFVNHLVKTYHNPQTPLIFNTHSMGGHIALFYLKKHPDVFDGAIMSAPMLDVYRMGLPPSFRGFFRVLFNAASAIGLRNVPIPAMPSLLLALSRARQYLKTMTNKPDYSFRGEFKNAMENSNPERQLGRPTFGWVAALYKSIDISMKSAFLKSIKTPTLIGSAGTDDLVSNDAHKRAAKLMPYVKWVTLEKAKHGLWFEKDEPYEEWWGHVEEFIKNIKPSNKHKKGNNKNTGEIIAAKDIRKTWHRGDLPSHNLFP